MIPKPIFTGNEGTATLYGSKQAAYGQPPVQDWGWDYPEIGWGNYSKNIETSPCFGRLMLCVQ